MCILFYGFAKMALTSIKIIFRIVIWDWSNNYLNYLDYLFNVICLEFCYSMYLCLSALGICTSIYCKELVNLLAPNNCILLFSPGLVFCIV